MHREKIMELKHPSESKGTAFQPQCAIANDHGLIAISEKIIENKIVFVRQQNIYNDKSDIDIYKKQKNKLNN
jgi:hypothetical protein